MDDIKVIFDETEDIKTTLDVGSIQYGQLEIGTTITGEAGTKASVTNTGSSAHAILNFTIPKGDKGDKGDAGSIKFVVVAELPTSNIDESAIYMKPSSNQEQNNTYEEFIYADGKWESLGAAQVKVDLEPYATKESLKQLQDNVEEVFEGNKPMGSIVVEDITCKNKFDKNTITSGYRLVTTGTYKDALYFVSDFIEVNPNDIYTVNYEVTAYTRMLFYNANKGIIGYNETSPTFTTPNNAKYVKLGQLLTELDNVQLEPGPVATDYVEHKEFENNEIYSTEEQVIGTFLGKPLYRKLTQLSSNLSITANNWTTIETNSEINRIIDCKISDKTDFINGLTYPCIGRKRTDDTIQIYSYIESTIKAYILEYTKTTD